MAIMMMLLGALIPTYLVSRLFRWLLKRMSPYARAVVANAASFAVCFVIAGFGSADGGPFAAGAGALYAIPQAAWLVFDLVRAKSEQARGAGAGSVAGEAQDRAGA